MRRGDPIEDANAIRVMVTIDGKRYDLVGNFQSVDNGAGYISGMVVDHLHVFDSDERFRIGEHRDLTGIVYFVWCKCGTFRAFRRFDLSCDDGGDWDWLSYPGSPLLTAMEAVTRTTSLLRYFEKRQPSRDYHGSQANSAECELERARRIGERAK